MPPPFSESTGQTFRTMEMFDQFQPSNATCSREDSHASRFQTQGEDSERLMIETSGRQCLKLFGDAGRLSSLLKTLLTSQIWFSENASMSWRLSAIGRSHLIFRLALLDYRHWN